jgi:hypothetical protein
MQEEPYKIGEFKLEMVETASTGWTPLDFVLGFIEGGL